jgi:predicted choloylglycine hydrolase
MPNLPGFLMLASGMNSKGLALGSQSVGAPHDGSPRFDPTGVSSAVAGRRLMEECRDVDEARAWLEKNHLTRCASIAACDLREQLIMEVTTKRVVARKADDGICGATNHFRCPELAGAAECWRYSRLDESRNLERLGIEDVATFMKATNQGRMTVHTMVFEPVPLCIHLAMGPGPATDRPLATINIRTQAR